MTEEENIVATLRAAGCVFAEEEAHHLITAARDPEDLEHMVAQRVSGLPLEHIVGWAAFLGLRVIVTPGVFVPRRRTELLVREALSILPAGATVLDIGCGCGAVGAALKSRVHIELYAVDIDPAAVACARRNLDPDRVLHGDLYTPLPSQLRGRVDLIAANAPYVPTDEIRLMPAEARLHEHRAALDGGEDGLDVLRRVVTGAQDWLVPGGHLLVETSRAQASVMVDFMFGQGFTPRIARDEELSATVVIGRRRTGSA